jgi:hypothetical protein
MSDSLQLHLTTTETPPLNKDPLYVRFLAITSDYQRKKHHHSTKTHFMSDSFQLHLTITKTPSLNKDPLYVRFLAITSDNHKNKTTQQRPTFCKIPCNYIQLPQKQHHSIKTHFTKSYKLDFTPNLPVNNKNANQTTAKTPPLG